MTAVDRRYRITEFMRCTKEGIGFLIHHGDGEMGILAPYYEDTASYNCGVTHTKYTLPRYVHRRLPLLLFLP